MSVLPTSERFEDTLPRELTLEEINSPDYVWRPGDLIADFPQDDSIPTSVAPLSQKNEQGRGRVPTQQERWELEPADETLNDPNWWAEMV